MFEERYVQYVAGIDISNWRNWLLDALPKSRPLSLELEDALGELKQYGFVSSEELLSGVMEFHDARRKFPRELLLPKDWSQWVSDVQPVLTIEEAKGVGQKIERAQALAKEVRDRGLVPKETSSKDGHEGVPGGDASGRVQISRERGVRSVQHMRQKGPSTELLSRCAEVFARCASSDEFALRREDISELMKPWETKALLVVLWADRGTTAAPEVGNLLWAPSEGFVSVAEVGGGRASVYAHDGSRRTIETLRFLNLTRWSSRQRRAGEAG
jgi:hypothetical protein